MKTNTAQREIVTNINNAVGMTIAATGKSFGVIIDKMYSDKPQSITREIWSNAYDAHRMAGKEDVPFLVQFPNSFDSSFRCRDYGEGMSHEFMMNEYTVAFHSTKEDTNKAVGFLGIGRLSPFSYTDTYSVTCWDGKEVRYYSVFLDEERKPRVSQMGVAPSSEPSGTEVAFAVDLADRGEFQRAAERVSLGFDVKPVCSRADIEWPSLKPLVEGDGWLIYEDIKDTSHPCYCSPYWSECFAKMGCVLYPIDANTFPYGSEERQLVAHGRLILNFDIGDLAVTSSREGLSFGRGEPTKENLVAGLARYSKEAVDKYLQVISEKDNPWDAKLALSELRKGPGHIIHKKVEKRAEWNGEKLKNTVLELPPSQCSVQIDSDFHRGKTIKWGASKYVEPTTDSIVVIQENEKGKRDVRAASRITQWQKGKPNYQKVLWFRVDDSNRQEVTDWLQENAPNLEIVYVKDLPDVPTARSTGGRRKPVSVKFCDSNLMYDVTLTKEEFDRGGVYMRIERNEPLAHQSGWSKVFRFLKSAGYVNNMIVVPKTFWTRFEKHPKWVELWDRTDQFIRDKGGLSNFRRVALRYGRSQLKLRPFPDVDSECVKLYNEYIKSSNHRDNALNLTPMDCRGFLSAYKKWDFYLEDRVHTRQAPISNRLRARCIEKYPLLRYADNLNAKDWQQYVNLMDKENENV